MVLSQNNFRICCDPVPEEFPGVRDPAQTLIQNMLPAHIFGMHHRQDPLFGELSVHALR